MQIYTKIFIGMAVGVLLGLTLGPRSGLLAPDLLQVRDPGTLALYQSPGGGELALKLPRGVKTRMTLLEQRGSGKQLYYRVAFKVSKQHVLADETGRLRAGTPVEAWVAAAGAPEPTSALGEDILGAIYPVGMVFLRLIKMVIVPLVFASLLVGVASLGDLRKLGRLGGKTLAYFLGTTTLAICIGLTLANLIKPGDFISPDDKRLLMAQFSADAASRSQQAAGQPSAVDNLLGIIPENPAASMASGEMLQIIFFALFFGVALTLIDPRRSATVVAFFEAVNDAMVM